MVNRVSHSLGRILILLAFAWTNTAYSQSDVSSFENNTEILESPTVKDTCQLRLDMQHNWLDHVAWTHILLISIADRLPDMKANLNYLLKNQDEIGNVFKPYYGDAEGKKLVALLKDHINIAGKLIIALRDNHPDQAKMLDQSWHKNADDIAAFLNSLNPKYWTLDEMKKMMSMHLDLTTKEVMAYLKHNYQQSVSFYDQVHKQIRELSETLSMGIINQYPNK
ncbi:MAG: glycosyltransferase [Bdellovibrio sp.]